MAERKQMVKQNTIELQSEKTADRLKEITGKLEKGVAELFESDRYKEYLRVMARFHRYSFNNTLLIAMQCPGATRLAGFQSWKKFGRHVKKGEKGIKVIAPTPFKKTVEEDGEEKEVVVPRYKVVSTYDVSQTEGKPLPEIASILTGIVDSYDDLMAALAQVSPVPIGFEDISGSAYGYYSTMEKRIAVREGLSEQQTLKTLVHEISHAKLHDVDLSKPKDERLDIDKRTMECQAEAIAFVCCERFGLDTSDYSFGYIAGWSSGRELKELRSSLEIIRNTAAEIIDSVEDCLQEMRHDTEQEEEYSSPVMAMQG